VKPDELFDAVVSQLGDDPGITPAKMFGSEGLKINGKFFASLYKGKLIVKLGEQRVDELAAAGKAEHFDPGMGRRMREWAEVPPSTREEWVSLAEESRSFVSS
jgi:TfoX/Sxy family transcriptional regulator of competence genes